MKFGKSYGGFGRLFRDSLAREVDGRLGVNQLMTGPEYDVFIETDGSGSPDVDDVARQLMAQMQGAGASGQSTIAQLHPNVNGTCPTCVDATTGRQSAWPCPTMQAVQGDSSGR